MMTEAARAARNEYRRKWYANNKEKAKRYMATYWERQAAKAEAERKTEHAKD